LTGHDTDVVVIGAGPYGLSISAHLSARRVRHETFGEPMELWSRHMPAGMLLKSEGFASNLADPRGQHTLEQFCREEQLEYGELAVPIRLDTFRRYGCWFQERLVPEVRNSRIEQVQQAPGGFEVALNTGETLRARRVVLATGVNGYAYLPPVLQGLPPEAVLHSYEHRDPASSRGAEVAVVGAGQSALESAALLHENGASVRVIARTPELAWNSKPGGSARPLRARLRYPESGLGEGLRQRACANHPLAFHFAPERVRKMYAYTVLGPAGAWWLRDRIVGQIEVLAGHAVVGARMQGDRVELQLDGPAGTQQVTVSQVIAGTGYRPDPTRLVFLHPAVRESVATVAGVPALDRSYESSVPGLYFVGYPAALSFGPVMRFVFGADFAARTVARDLAS
jgi:lysine/ornithine N-monooxygenase